MSHQRSTFEEHYLKVRQLEGRVYSDEKVAQLPELEKNDPHHSEWKLRAKSAKRFLNYLKENPQKSKLLEIGCGNGWFTHHCSEYVANAVGIDVNHTELEQAKRVFKKENLTFKYWDIFTPSPFKFKFDYIVLNAVVQYFPNSDLLITRLKELLADKGEIHIIDSPFYKPNEIDAAKKRTERYYKKMGVPEMAELYYHHSLTDIFDFECLYEPGSSVKLLRFLKEKDSPFGWYRWKK